MQGKSKILGVFLVLLSAFMLSACGGGSTGSTWFNLPSIPLRIQPDGTAKVFGFSIPNQILPPATIQQLQGANVQELQVRVGYNGIHVYNNGVDLPYIKWDESSVDALGNVLKSLPPEMGVPGDMIAGYLPMLRQYGMGVTLDMPVAEGQTAVDIPRWSGETTVTEEAGGESSLPALSLGGIAFDDSGNASLAGVALPGVALPPNVMGILKSLGAENLQVQTQPNGLNLSLNGQPLPSIAYDSSSLAQVMNVAGAFLGEEATSGMLGDIVPQLQGADLNLDLSFTGQPSGEFVLPDLDVVVGEDGSVTALGFPLGAGMLPADLLGQLESANIQNLNVDLSTSQIKLGVNGEALPVINLGANTLDTFVNDMAEPLLGMSPDALSGNLGLVKSLMADKPLKVNLTLPGGQPSSGEIDTTLQAPEMGDFAPPTIHVNATYAGGKLADLNGITAEQLGDLASSIPELPANIQTMLQSVGANQVEIKNGANKLSIMFNGDEFISLDYDAPTLKRLLDLAGPFLGPDSPLSDPALSTIINDQILPLAPGSDIDITLNLQ
ncbi:MAG: hypothetical protein R3A44_39240 [Caldilineaceae bacterium]